MSKQSVSTPTAGANEGSVQLAVVLGGGKGETGSVRLVPIKGAKRGWATFGTDTWAFDGIDWEMQVGRDDLDAQQVSVAVEVLVARFGTDWPKRLFAAQQEWAKQAKNVAANREKTRLEAEAAASKSLKPGEIAQIEKAISSAGTDEGGSLIFRGAQVAIVAEGSLFRVTWVKVVKASVVKGTDMVTKDRVPGWIARNVK